MSLAHWGRRKAGRRVTEVPGLQEHRTLVVSSNAIKSSSSLDCYPLHASTLSVLNFGWMNGGRWILKLGGRFPNIHHS